MKNKISWTDQTWNPVVGCSHAGTPGCDNCFAARMAKRQAGMARAKRAKGQDPGRSAHYEKVENWDGVALVREALKDPLKWKKSRRVFVCSMADLFHKDVPTSYIGDVLDVIGSCDQHVFQLLTKRPQRALDVLSWYYKHYNGGNPYDNVQMGVTAEDQQRADERIPILLRTPAAFHFASLEPLLGGIDLCGIDAGHQVLLGEKVHYCLDALSGDVTWQEKRGIYSELMGEPGPRLNLAIVGGETGPGARPMKPSWPRSLRDQCAAAGVGFHFKSHGEWVEFSPDDHAHIMPKQGPDGEIANFAYLTEDGKRGPLWKNKTTMVRVGAKTAGRLLDGIAHRDL